MMYGDIEPLVISGELFDGDRSTPGRSISPEHDGGWHDDELELDSDMQRRDMDLDEDSDTARRWTLKDQQKDQQLDAIGMGPGRTGVKGVIRDRDEALEICRDKRAKAEEELVREMEATNLGGKTYLEEEREKLKKGEGKVDALVAKELVKPSERRHAQRPDKGFGHLREVGMNGFLSAIEEEDKGTWVVVHLYDPSLERCYVLDDSLAHLARAYPDTKFVRARASALGFASLSSRKKRGLTSRQMRNRDDDLDDSSNDNNGYDSDGDDVDLDVLPTMLVYRDGELVHNWVRVDWEVGSGTIKDILDSHHILQGRSAMGRYDLALCDNEDDLDLDWGDENDIK